MAGRTLELYQAGFPTPLQGNPGAGNEFSASVPTGKTWVLQSIRAQFTTSAVAANRLVRFTIDDGANLLWQTADPNAQTASLAMFYEAASDVVDVTPAAAANAQVVRALPKYRLPAGYRIRTNTAAKDAGDTFTTVTLSVVEFDYVPGAVIAL